MAESPSHKFGQIIGNVLQDAVESLLVDFAMNRRLYLDKKGRRPARPGKKVTWLDRRGNSHDLDYVLEKGGSDTRKGTPVAFIEVAYRRYTKHSRNKAQEIQGAILALAETYSDAAPFIGTILAGDFTQGALRQLQSLGFTVLHLPYENVVEAFETVGIDAYFDEDTPDSELAQKVALWASLPPNQHASVAHALLRANAKQFSQFMDSFASTVTREIQLIRILPLHGTSHESLSISGAIAFIDSYDDEVNSLPLVSFEVEIHYSNGDQVDARFADKRDAIRFLRSF